MSTTFLFAATSCCATNVSAGADTSGSGCAVDADVGPPDGTQHMGEMAAVVGVATGVVASTVVPAAVGASAVAAAVSASAAVASASAAAATASSASAASDTTPLAPSSSAMLVCACCIPSINLCTSH